MSWRGKAVCLLALLASGCPNDPTSRDECGPVPSFLVTIHPEQGGLPEDLSLAVEFGGGNEEVSIRDGLKGQVIFCDLVSQEPGEGGASGTDPIGYGSLLCELWTEGPATTPIELELSAKTPPI
jgi:hypothetical protein